MPIYSPRRNSCVHALSAPPVLPGAFALRQTLQSQVYGLAVMDPIVISVVSITLGIIALAACSLPAKRAAQVHPAALLNQQ
jgi:ABC-type lipoprotein release transport system permease subunit